MKSAKQWVDEVVYSPKEKMDPEEFVRMVQLDSWKQGMTDAASMISAQPYRKEILRARDSKTTP